MSRKLHYKVLRSLAASLAESTSAIFKTEFAHTWLLYIFESRRMKTVKLTKNRIDDLMSPLDVAKGITK